MDEYDKNIQAYVVDEEFIQALLGDLPQTHYDVTKLDELSPYEMALRKFIGYSIPGAIYNIADSFYRHKMEKIIDELNKENKK